MENSIDILLLQEPYSRDNKLIGLGMTTSIIKHDSELPRDAIAVLNPELQVLKLTHSCTPHFVIAQVSNGQSNFYIASAYFQLSHEIEPHQKGKKFEDFIAEWRLTVNNNPNDLPTSSNERGEGYIDVTLATNNNTLMCFEWRVRDGWTSSDHRAITF